MVGNLVLRRSASGAVKPDFLTYIPRYTSPNEHFECGYPHSNALLQFYLNFERYMPNKTACHLTKCDVVNDAKVFPIVYSRIYCRKYLRLSNQTSHYKSKCIRMTGHSFLNSHKAKMDPNVSSLCSACEVAEDTYHFIFTCYLYKNDRGILQSTVESILNREGLNP